MILNKGLKILSWVKEKIVKKDLSRLKRIAKSERRRFVFSLLKFVLIFYLGAAFVGVKFLYPLHFSFGFLIIGYAFYRLVRDLEVVFVKLSELRIFKYKKRIYSVVQFLIILIALGEMFSNSELYNFAENKKMINEDIETAAVVMDRLEVIGLDLINDPALEKSDVTIAERERLQERWKHFIMEVMVSERMTERHKYFYQIPFFMYREDFSKSFVVAYSLYSKKYELFLRLIGKIDNNENIKMILNERLEEFDDDGFYSNMSYHFYKPRTRFKLSAGRAVLSGMPDGEKMEGYGASFKVLKNKSYESYGYLFRNFNVTLWNGVAVGVDIAEDQVFGMWFPVQKNVANLMGNINIASRDYKLIEVDQIKKMRKFMEPGDIMVQRRNWYVSNVGIPGFWPHAALYIGSIDEADEYFSEVFPFDGFESFRDYLMVKERGLHDDYIGADESDFEYSVIEAIAPGVVVQSLEESARADYVGVLRPNLSKSDKLKSVLRAFSNYGKPYDYDFDFLTKDAMVCSELVYDAYYQGEGKDGLDFDLKQVSGRQVYSPTDIVNKFYDEYGLSFAQLEFVYFLDGNEESGLATPKGVEEFLKTHDRPKFSYSLE